MNMKPINYLIIRGINAKAIVLSSVRPLGYALAIEIGPGGDAG